ncbi:MAG TPA: hypothetical protein VIW29_23200 [Polyangiaceae bacterium]
MRPAWAYIVGGVAGGVAGGVGGYFVEQNADPRASLLMLAGGLVFAIPTAVAVLAATAYEPPAGYLQDEPPADEPVAEPPAPKETPAAAPPSETAPPPAEAAPAAAPTGQRHLHSKRRLSLQLPPPALFGFRDSRLALGVPNLEVREVYTASERAMFNAPDATELRIPLIDVVF